MRNLIFVFLSLFLANSISFGQSSSVVSYRYDVSNVITTGDITGEHYDLLEQKIKNSYPGKSVFSNQTPFSIVPNIKVLDAKNSGEMHKVVKLGVSLSIEDLDNYIAFKQYETIVLATDSNLPKAISKAIKQIKSSDPKLKNFFLEAEKDIQSFYQSNCSKIIKSARVNIERKNFNKAFALLKYVPEDGVCFSEAERLLTRIYIDSKEENCREMLHKGRLEKAGGNYSEAVNHLSYIDPTADCHSEAVKLLKEIDELLTEKTLSELKMKQLEYEKKTELEKVKILANAADYLKMESKKE